MKITYDNYLKEVKSFFTTPFTDESIKAMYEIDEENKDHGERFRKECQIDKEKISEMFK